MGTVLERVGQVSQKIADQFLIKGVEEKYSRVTKSMDKSIVAARNRLISSRNEIMELGSAPSPQNPQVIRALFVNLGIETKRLKTWTDIRRKVTSQLLKEIFTFDPMSPTAVDSLAEVEELLKDITAKDLEADGEGVGSIHAFLHAQLKVRDKALADTAQKDLHDKQMAYAREFASKLRPQLQPPSSPKQTAAAKKKATTTQVAAAFSGSKPLVRGANAETAAARAAPDPPKKQQITQIKFGAFKQ
eukprot:TRINITY_DN20722_c0_g2_i3.p1 TRINITY_DN20722_c0_g2~~TRINITY_DN20722_c0_g2_i3.p1  ORF type:complete len:246 (+),score=91.87 TRINITY_DN20722_c0_g2_i3:252-989(+)